MSEVRNYTKDGGWPVDLSPEQVAAAISMMDNWPGDVAIARSMGEIYTLHFTGTAEWVAKLSDGTEVARVMQRGWR